jgi:uncharacterized protein YkwD
MQYPVIFRQKRDCPEPMAFTPWSHYLVFLIFSFCCLSMGDAQAADMPRRITPKHKIKENFTPQEIELVDLTNKVRTDAGLTPLKINAHLTHAARKHSARMARKQKLAHLVKGKDFHFRLKKVGYTFARAGENVGRSKGCSSHVINMWMNSPGHRNNILNPAFKDIGIGISTSEKGEKYFTQVFGTQR